MSHKRNEALRHVQHSMHHVIAAGEGSDRAPDSCKLCPYHRPDFKFRTCLYAHCPYCLNLDLPQLRRMAYLLQNCSNNLNQVAKRVNESGKIYAADLADLRTRLDELIDIGKQILSKLAEL